MEPIAAALDYEQSLTSAQNVVIFDFGGVLVRFESEAGRRKWALMRATALMALLVFPLAVGLGAVAPTLVAVLFNEEWQGVAPLLVILSVLSVVRPVAWVLGSYLIAQRQTRAVMAIEVLKVVLSG